MREKWKKEREEVDRRGRVRKMKSMTNEGGKRKGKKGEKEQDMISQLEEMGRQRALKETQTE